MARTMLVPASVTTCTSPWVKLRFWSGVSRFLYARVISSPPVARVLTGIVRDRAGRRHRSEHVISGGRGLRSRTASLSGRAGQGHQLGPGPGAGLTEQALDVLLDGPR